MRIDEELAQLSPDADSVLTIGVFDGVHRGHHHLISRLTSDAGSSRRLAGVVTFRDHPASVLRPDFKPRYLTRLDERVGLIERLGVDFVVPVTFDLELSRLSARGFIERLRRHLRMSALVIGPGFVMGHKQEGTEETLVALGQEIGFSVTAVGVLMDGGRAIRSTMIRQAIAEGDVADVSQLLGRSFALRGIVAKGAGRGKTLGFPTVNLAVPPDMAIPGNGIYATWARWGERVLMAATSIGTRPTFAESERTVEAFILDFDGDLYGRELRLEFVQRLRDEVKYDSVQALQDQIASDVDQARSALQTSRPNPR
jgi:riboflavin kinase/FMN adenylyltransferase